MRLTTLIYEVKGLSGLAQKSNLDVLDNIEENFMTSHFRN